MPCISNGLPSTRFCVPVCAVTLKLLTWMAVAAAAALFAGCSSAPEPTIPALTSYPTGIRDSGRVISQELATLDIEKSKAFYAGVFGWTFEEVEGTQRNYATISHNGQMIGGVFEFDQAEKQTSTGEWIPVFSVSDVDAAAAATKSSGGTVVVGPRDMPDWGYAFLGRDPREAVFFALRSAEGDPPETEPVVNGFLWSELWTDDLESSAAFYGSVLDFTVEDGDVDFDQPYKLFKNGDTVRGGVMEIENPEVRPHWVPFIKVDDVSTTVEKAREAGARVIIEPHPDIRDGAAALILDPVGAPIALQEYDS